MNMQRDWGIPNPWRFNSRPSVHYHSWIIKDGWS